jgi:HlyD family secretion protein
MRRLIKWLLILGVVIGGIAYGVSIAQQRLRTPPSFRTAKVAKGKIEAVVNSTGTIKPVQLVSIGATVNGPIAEILVHYNSIVKKGELLARIDPRILNATVEIDRAALKIEQAELARNDALLQQARNSEERVRRLLTINKDYVSDTEMDQMHFTRVSLEAQRLLIQARVTQVEAKLKQSETNLTYSEVRSPVDGVVIERKVDPGQTMAAAFQTPEMFIIAPDMSTMHVFASVDEADIGQINKALKEKRPVKFTVDSYPDRLFEGVIHQIRQNATTTSNVVTYPVVIEVKNERVDYVDPSPSAVPNPQWKLRPSMTANISFVIEVKEDAMRIPAAALRYYPQPTHVRPEDRPLLEGAPVQTSNPQEQELKPSATEKVEAVKKRFKRIVWIKDPDSELLRAVPVTLGLYDNQWAELVEGNLTEGQEVVTGLGTAPPPPATR